ncbi:MAG: hypothetical protein IKQ54_02025 [Oscillospiraceae bacterium]|nr:hypothetical protein [Oscillospiraceae bacterium]
MNERKLLYAIGEVEDRFIADAAPTARKRSKTAWVRWAAAACLCLGIFAVALLVKAPGFTAALPTGDPSAGETESQQLWNGIKPRNPLDSASETQIIACYTGAYSSVEDLLKDTVLIVRATPVAVETESDAAICWILEIAESSDGRTGEIKLRQLKDEYLLVKGQEVVLALENDSGPGYYNIPGGGVGLFRKGGVRSEFWEPLLQRGRTEFPEALRETGTLLEVYDCLTILYNVFPSPFNRE